MHTKQEDRQKRLQQVLINGEASINEVITRLNDIGVGVLLVVDEQRHLLGTITDGDVRRAVLNRVSLHDPCYTIANHSPVTAHYDDSQEMIFHYFDHNAKQCLINHVPVVNGDNMICDLFLRSDFGMEEPKKNIAIIMAGGLGSRLSPLTDDCPKPMLKISSKPVLEILLETLIANGFEEFFISVNYKSEMIKNYFSGGEKWGVRISYLEEDNRLGTAGALSLFPLRPDDPIVVVNADIITKVNFMELLAYHESKHAMATVCVREFQQMIPYGIMEINGHQLIDIKEKPIHKYFVNTGIYVIDSKILSLIPKGQYFDMTDLLQLLLEQDQTVTTFPVHEYWLDIGRLEDLERAHEEYSKIFV